MAALIVAAVQDSPVFLDRAATIARVDELTGKAAAEGAGLVVFPEAFVPTYPDWIWRTKPWDGEATALYGRLVDQAVVVPSAATVELGRIAAAHGVYLVVGVNELAPNGGSTLYCSLLYFDPAGELVSRHRKLMPTGGERLVWGQGDGSTLGVIDTPFGRVGGLICWENYMPLARAAMYAQGVDLYLAPTWDDSDDWLVTMRHIAREGRCYVLSVNTCMRASDVPADAPGRDELYAGGDDDWMSRGNAVIVDPTGQVLAGPLCGEPGILYAEIDPARPRAERMQFDPVGHYSRPDVLRLLVDIEAKPAATLQGPLADAAPPDPDRGGPPI
jgi:nitrilase